VGGKTDNNDLVLFSKVAETVCAVRIVAVKDEETVATTCVPCGGGWVKVAFKPLAAKFLVSPAFRGV
jgi:hypothetical protein